MKLIPKIRDLRKKNYLTQTQLSEKTGLSETYISQIENGKSYPNAENLWIIAKGIGCKVDDLYEISE